MAKVIAIGQPINDAERMVIAHLRDHLPDTYTLIHNFELTHYNHPLKSTSPSSPHTPFTS
jgi:hypothetical protein